jgi:uncharacterized protein YlxP (DUF503 family)
MVVGLCTIELHLPGSQSLKAKRQVLLSLKDRLREKFNVSVAEVAEHDRWQKAVLGIPASPMKAPTPIEFWTRS